MKIKNYILFLLSAFSLISCVEEEGLATGFPNVTCDALISGTFTNAEFQTHLQSGTYDEPYVLCLGPNTTVTEDGGSVSVTTSNLKIVGASKNNSKIDSAVFNISSGDRVVVQNLNLTSEGTSLTKSGAGNLEVEDSNIRFSSVTAGNLSIKRSAFSNSSGSCLSLSGATVTMDDSTCSSSSNGLSISQVSSGSSSLEVSNSTITTSNGARAVSASIVSGPSVSISISNSEIYSGGVYGSIVSNGSLTVNLSENTFYSAMSSIEYSVTSTGTIVANLSDNEFRALTSSGGFSSDAISNRIISGGYISLNDNSSGTGNFFCNDPNTNNDFSSILSNTVISGGSIGGTFTTAGTANGGDTVSTCP